MNSINQFRDRIASSIENQLDIEFMNLFKKQPYNKNTRTKIEHGHNLAKIATSMIEPLKVNINYDSIWRTFGKRVPVNRNSIDKNRYKIDTLPDVGVVYDKDLPF